MIFSVALLLGLEIVSRQSVECLSIDDQKNCGERTKLVNDRDGNNSITDYVRGGTVESLKHRVERDLENIDSTESSVRFAYEKAMNKTRSDYYAQRKAVMERYYARQREIVDKFGGKTTNSLSTGSFTTTEDPKNFKIVDGESTNERARNASVTSEILGEKKTYHEIKSSQGKETNGEDKNNNSTVSWLYRFNNWNPKVPGNETDVNVQAESSSSVDKTEHPGYYRLGEFKGSKDEKIVYQHNLGVGLKGSSQLEANFEIVLEGAFEITAIEAFPYANTRAHFSWIAGGPGANSVKLKLRGYEDEGFSYTVKVWGVPK